MKRFGLIAGASLLLGVVLLAIFGGFFTPDPDAFDLSLKLQTSHAGHWLGFDEEGRDLLALLVHGARVSLIVGVATVSLSAFFGTLLGAAAGYFGGRWDHLFIFATDVVLAFPSILLIIALAAFRREGGVMSMIILLSAVGWVGYARLARSQILSLKERDYVHAARGLGSSTPRILFRHLLPHLTTPLFIQATFGMAGVILAESTLSFLGLGIATDTPTWGRLMDQGVQYLLVAPHIAFATGVSMAVTILGFNFLGDGLRDALDVKEV